MKYWPERREICTVQCMRFNDFRISRIEHNQFLTTLWCHNLTNWFQFCKAKVPSTFLIGKAPSIISFKKKIKKFALKINQVLMNQSLYPCKIRRRENNSCDRNSEFVARPQYFMSMKLKLKMKFAKKRLIKKLKKLSDIQHSTILLHGVESFLPIAATLQFYWTKHSTWKSWAVL